MDEKTLECVIAHFDKKVTDYQIYVDRVMQEQNNKIKQLEDYSINTLSSYNKILAEI